jgi:hypothetical protein
MERLIAFDKLAREDRFVRMRARDVAQLKVDQGLPPFPDRRRRSRESRAARTATRSVRSSIGPPDRAKRSPRDYFVRFASSAMALASGVVNGK